MATAEAKARKEEEASSRHHEPSSSDSASRRVRRGTRQLDFFQAMTDFRQMFPTLDDEVIEAVLRANDGAVDATIDQLLTMTIDEDITSKVTEGELMKTYCPQYDEQDQAGAAAEDSPPSYSEAIRAQADQAQSIWTTPIGQTFMPSRNMLDSSTTDPLSLSLTEPKGAMAQLSPNELSGNKGAGLTPLRTNNTESNSRQFRKSYSSDQNTRRKVEFKNWNPPMLGNLPDDFLRLIPPDSGNGSAKSDSDRTANLTASPVNVMSVRDVKPKIHKSRSKSEKILSQSFSSSSRDKDVKVKSSDKKAKSSDKMSRSFSLVEQPSSNKQKVSRSHSGRSKDKNVNNGMSPSHRAMQSIETHDFSKDMLEERMKENERRRKKTSARADPELAQYLEDERLALALQNSEFLQELRGNEDFMKTLRKDSSQTKKSTTQEPQDPIPIMTRPPDSVHEGYGDDTDKTLDAFPFSQPVPKGKDDDAELRRQLSGMGKASRKQLASLAKKFFKRKKKTSKQILGEKLAPSMMNLLEDEEEDEEEEDLFSDRRYGNSPPEIEPLPLPSVPSHRTVQRPAYNPDGVTTYFDNKNMDMV